MADNNRSISRTLKAAGAAGISLGLIGLLGIGCSERNIHTAPNKPDALSGYTAPLDYKGQTRFVSTTDARIHLAGTYLLFGGIGGGAAVALVYWLLTGRPPFD
jgi:hypothetical protein